MLARGFMIRTKIATCDRSYQWRADGSGDMQKKKKKKK
jgi:hypothetical protein